MSATLVPKSLRIAPQAVLPANPRRGDITYYPLVNPEYLQWDGSNWIPFGSGGGISLSYAMAGDNSGTLVLPNSTSLPMPLLDIQIDNDSIVDSANNQIVIQKPGIYNIYAQSLWQHTTGYVECDIEINGVIRVYGLSVAAGAFAKAQAESIFSLSPGDTVRALLYQTSGVSQSPVGSAPVWSTYITVQQLPMGATPVTSNSTVTGSVRKSSVQSVPDSTYTKVDDMVVLGGLNGLVWDYANSRFVVQSSGYYLLNGSLSLDGLGAGGTFSLSIWKNGTDILNQAFDQVSSAAGARYVSNTYVAYLEQNDYIELMAYQNGGTTQNVIADSSYNQFQATKIEAASTSLTPTSFIGVSAYLSTSTPYLSDDTVVFDTEEYDTASAYNTITGQFAAPLNGYYRVSLCTQGSSTSTAYLYKNGTTGIGYLTESSSAVQEGSMTVFLLAGDTIEVKLDGPNTLAGPAAQGKITYLDIERIGG